MIKLVIAGFTWFLFFTQVWCTLPKLTIYEKPDYRGDSITFTKKYANLSNFQKLFLTEAGSYCGTGLWQFLDLPNFEYNSSFFFVDGKTKVCGNNSFGEFNSARFLGPANSETPTIALYEGNKFHGREYLVTGPAGNDIQFNPVFALLFGNWNWTLFTGKNFDGNSICFTSKHFFHDTISTGWMSLNSSFIVQSVAKGCDTVEVARNIDLFKK